MTDAGIDYGNGKTNIDTKTGIRYGVISQHTVGEAWYESSEPDYGEPSCPECGNSGLRKLRNEGEVPAYAKNWEKFGQYPKYACVGCKALIDADRVYGDEPNGWTLDDGTYKAMDCLDSDIMILSSPYYTFGRFCSPCVPGGVSLPDDPTESKWSRQDAIDANLPRAYCFDHDWFEDGIAPYRVYRVVDDSEVISDKILELGETIQIDIESA